MYLLMARLFFLEPKRPCKKMIGGEFKWALSTAGRWHSYARGRIDLEL